MPESIIVRLKRRGSYTGHLTAFNTQSLTIAANSYSQKISLSQITSLKFQGGVDVWIPNPDGTRRRGKIRGASRTLEGLPVTAFNLNSPPKTATLNLATMSRERFEQFSEDTNNKAQALAEILFDSPEKITVKVKEVQ